MQVRNRTKLNNSVDTGKSPSMFCYRFVTYEIRHLTAETVSIRCYLLIFNAILTQNSHCFFFDRQHIHNITTTAFIIILR